MILTHINFNSVKILYTFILIISCLQSVAQNKSISGIVLDINDQPIRDAIITIPKIELTAITDSSGSFKTESIPFGSWKATISAADYSTQSIQLMVSADTQTYTIRLLPKTEELDGVVLSATLSPISKENSPIPVEVYSAKFFKANPSSCVFDALQNINGVRPQINCNICNTGDIHINGLEGPYTMVLIDGMPIVSGLSSVYGLSGIPQSLIERVEIVKGPASTLYGSEAVGGLINIITKSPEKAPVVAADIFATSWQELNADVAAKLKTGKQTQALLGINYFNYQNPIDNNQDNFTDLTIQHRVSIFNKWHFTRQHNRLFSFAARYVYENRWGGEMDWNKSFRGTDQVYGESIYTNRWELFGTYQLPVKEKILLQFSANNHLQNSVYGTTLFNAQQTIGFAQLTWFKNMGAHEVLTGMAFRYTFYDDNTPATAHEDNLEVNKPSHSKLPGVFIQDQITLSENQQLLLGVRYDYHSLHGSIFSPRANYKWHSANKFNIIRLSIGNGYRIANVFTEDHAALTGARAVVFKERLAPETSWNGNINFTKKIVAGGTLLNIDISGFYTFFNNKIIADYTSNANQIIYNNLTGYAVSKGVSLNMEIDFPKGPDVILGCTAMDVYSVANHQKEQQLFTEQFTGTWTVSYTLRKWHTTIDYTGNAYSPMHLPLLSTTDPRQARSPWWSIQNIQVTQKLKRNFEVYGGIKNLLNWTPNRGNPFIIARAHDPFDKAVVFNNEGNAVSTPDNPYGLTFDPTYVYGPNQGRRVFLGLRYYLN